MLSISKDMVLEVIENAPSILIGREILFNGSSSIIEDVNLRCTRILIRNPTTQETKWLDVNDLENETVFDSFDLHSHGQNITVKTILDLLVRE